MMMMINIQQLALVCLVASLPVATWASGKTEIRAEQEQQTQTQVQQEQQTDRPLRFENAKPQVPKEEWWPQQQQQKQEQLQAEDVQVKQDVQVVEQERLEAPTKGGLLRPFLPSEPPKAEAEPYAFGYSVDGSARQESGDSRGVVRGSYSINGADGSQRLVEYIADQNGFRASINTNEFGTESRSPANVQLRSSQPLAEELALREQPLLASGGQQQQQIKGASGSEASWWRPTLPPSLPSLPTLPASLPSTLPHLPTINLPERLERTEGIKGSTRRVEEPPLAPRKGEGEIKRAAPVVERSAEIKEARQSPVALRAVPSFTSATAHRRYDQPAAASRSQQQQLVRNSARPTYLAPPSYFGRNAASYRRQQVEPVGPNPRPTFYGFEEDN